MFGKCRDVIAAECCQMWFVGLIYEFFGMVLFLSLTMLQPTRPDTNFKVLSFVRSVLWRGKNLELTFVMKLANGCQIIYGISESISYTRIAHLTPDRDLELLLRCRQ